MPSNRARIDIDLVQPTQYHVLPYWCAKKQYPKPWPLPKFEPLYIDDWDNHGLLKLPPNVNSYDPFQLFNLFFIDEIIDKLIAWTNEYVELYPPNKEKKHL